MSAPLSAAAQAAQTATWIGANPPRVATFNERVIATVQRAKLHLDLTDEQLRALAMRADTPRSPR